MDYVNRKNCIPWKVGQLNLLGEQNLTKVIYVQPIIEFPYIQRIINESLICGPIVSVIREFIKREKSL